MDRNRIRRMHVKRRRRSRISETMELDRSRQPLVDLSPVPSHSASSASSTRPNPTESSRDDFSSRSNSLSPNRHDVVSTVKTEFEKMNEKLTVVANKLEDVSSRLHETTSVILQLLIFISVSMLKIQVFIA